MNRADWDRIITDIKDRWPNTDIPPATLEAWFNSLQHHPAGSIVAAVETYYGEGHSFPPNGSQLAGIIRDAAAPGQPDRELPDPAGCRHPAPFVWLPDGMTMCRLCHAELGVVEAVK